MKQVVGGILKGSPFPKLKFTVENDELGRVDGV